MRPCPYPITALLPHRPPMVLLDEVVEYDAEALVAGVTIGPHSLFVEKDGVPAHIGIEYMAQACGAYAGAQALDAGGPVRVGFLLGTRKYDMRAAWFRPGDHLTVSVAVTYQDDEMAAFDCSIEVGGEIAAKAQLSVYQPPGDITAGESPP